MSKKLSTACVALVAFAAFALPAVASATPRLCETEGTVCSTLATGVKITSQQVGVSKLTSGGMALLECFEGSMTGTLNKNNAEAVEGTIETATFSGTATEGRCTGPVIFGATRITTNVGEGVPWCVKASGTEDKVTIRGGSCSGEARGVTFVTDSVNFGSCKYSRTRSVEGTLTTHTSSSEDAVITVTSGAGSEFTKEEGSSLCPEKVTLDMSMTLTTDNEAKTTLYAASERPRLCETEGTACNTLATGVKITSHQVGVSRLTSGGAVLVECAEGTMTGTLNRNDATAVEGTIESASFSGTATEGKCTSPLGAGPTRVTTNVGEGVPWCVRAAGTEDKVTVRGGRCSEEARGITFVIDTTFFGTCRYVRSTAIQGTLTTHTSSSEDAVITVATGAGSEFTKEEVSNPLCPEHGTLDMSMTLTTDNSPTFTTLYAENV